MRFAEDYMPDTNVIRAYGEGEITVNEGIIRRHVVVTSNRLITDWAPDFDSLAHHHIAALKPLDPEILVIGTGAQLKFPDPACTADFLTAGIGVEVMDTAAACRTYNILLSEGRRVVAALFMI